jgi:peptidoglycan/LPS O-acetylase OafA/YrhL
MLLKRKPRYFGRISFSLYLVYVPVILASTIIIHGEVSLALLIVIVVPVVIAIADAFERLVTAPSVTLGQRLARTGRESLFTPESFFEQSRV